MRAALIVVAVALAGTAFAVARGSAQTADREQYRSPWKTPWDYEGARGAAHWSQLDSAYAACAGREQSPIDIGATEKADLPRLEFSSRSGPLRYVINNGHTIRVDYRPGNGDSLVAEGRRYELTQFHFHRPSEETIAGAGYPMEVHLMYQARDGKVAGVTVFIQSGRSNATVDKVWEHMPRAEGQNAVPGVDADPADLLPRDTHGYYAYSGSLTAPPCTEGVRWFVLKRPIELTAAQIDAFARLYPNDARPVQPLNGRIVRESK